MNHPAKIDLYLKAKQAYYAGHAIMPDVQFDILEDEIRAVDPNEPALKMVGAPVPINLAESKGRHLIHMGSQEKVTSWDELVRWQKLRANDPDALYHASFKADGGSLALYYRKGKLVDSITRGEGDVGQSIPAQAALFQGVPIQLPEPLDIGIRCEAVVTLDDWPYADPTLASNPRNVANGILGRLDCIKSRFITVVAFNFDELPDGDPLPDKWRVTSESSKYRRLEDLGFITTPWKGNLTLEKVAEFFEETRKERDDNKLPFWIDGMIVRYERLSVQEELGSSDNRPKGQVAWKFPPEIATSFIREVIWQVGHTGAVTPVAIIDPVRIGGTTVSKASLANVDNIYALGAYINAEVEVVKSGDIIPQITRVISPFDASNPEHKLIEILTTCPVCEAKLGKRKNVNGSESVVIFCEGDDCDAQISGRILRFVKSRDILGLGKSIVESLAEASIVTDVPDLFTFNPHDIQDLIINEAKGVRLGLKRAQGIADEVKAKGTKMSVAEFIGSFGTRSLGVRRATLMIEANPALEDLDRWLDGSLKDEAFATAAGVPKAGAQIAEGIDARWEIIQKTREFVTITKAEPKPQLAEGGKVICITGSLPSGKKKKDYVQPLADAGHRLVDDLTKEVNILVMADPNGPESSKTKKAKKMGIELWSEDQLKSLIS